MKTQNTLRAAALAILLESSPGLGAVRYVWQASPSSAPPYDTWASAAHDIQTAVDVAVTGDEIVVTNGIYDAGGKPVSYSTLTNRVAVDKALRLRSVNGPQVTSIVGAKASAGGPIRCMYLASGASVSGFTLTNGSTQISSSSEYAGGGVYCASASAVVSNCLIMGNIAAWGGGSSGGTLNNCTLSGNSVVLGYWMVSGGGGGSADGVLNNCELRGNTAEFFGGGAAGGTLNNSTLSGNAVSANVGGGAWNATLNNCIVYFNSGREGSNYYYCTMNYCCTAPLPADSVGNITAPPQFVNYAGGNLRLQSGSPCINAGNSSYVTNSTDLDGRPRLIGTVDMGAYEFQGPFNTWLQQYGLPTDGSADYTDADLDGHNNWQEWRCQTDPTNSVSVLQLLSALPAGNDVAVTWQSISGVNYFLERSTNITGLPGFTRLDTNCLGQTGTTTFTDINAASLAPLFYRVGVGP